MARKKVAEAKAPTLNELILEYGPLNTECNTLKKTVADLNSKIKLAIHDAKKENESIEVEGWRCTLSVTDDSSFNEDRLIDFCKRNNIKVVKKKEYIDHAELERLIYNGKISKEMLVEMDKCKDSKTKETLRCVKA